MTKILGSMVVTVVLLTGLAVESPGADEKWPGIDEAVVNKVAKEHGREARKPLFDTGQGDMQLFMFLMAGVVGGFAAGYYWRALLEGKQSQNKDKT